MTNRPSLDDYIDVAERIAAFTERYPEGTLQTLDWQVTRIGEQQFIVYRAAAYRNPDDVRPGHGIAWEPFPGTTPYTRNSELMNAETAAWGRAIVACGLAANRKIASRQEVRARMDEQPQAQIPASTGNGRLSRETVDGLVTLIKEAGVSQVWVRMNLVDLGVENVPEKVTKTVLAGLSREQAEGLHDRLTAMGTQA